jgi:DNA-directed RNA polymerase subunit RPC12/RpoP
MIAKCPCEHCEVNIEFATEEFLSGSTITCPHCGKETHLFVSPQAKPVPKETQKLTAHSKALQEEYFANLKRGKALAEEATKKAKEATKKASDAGVALKKFHWPGDTKGSRLLAESDQLRAEAEQLLAKAFLLREDDKRLKKLWEESLKFALRADGSEPSANYATCPCQHCGKGIEFNAAELAEENSVIACPHCGLETKLFIPQQVSPQKVEAPIPNVTASPQKAEATIPNEMELNDLMDGLTSHELNQALKITDWAAKMDFLKSLQKGKASRMKIVSINNELELADDKIIIRRHGVAHAMAAGLTGERMIPISTLTAIQLKLGVWWSPGFILFSYAGSKPFMGGIIEATQDPDAFIFQKELNDEVSTFKAKVENILRDSKQVTPALNSPPALTDEIRKLAELKQQGILSQEEFDAAKRKLLL